MASLKQADLGPVKSGQEAEFFLTYFCATPAGPKVVAEPNRIGFVASSAAAALSMR